jgi:hypothetical protein
MARNYGKIGAPQEVDRTRCKLDRQLRKRRQRKQRAERPKD